jgi:hypothetical protein
MSWITVSFFYLGKSYHCVCRLIPEYKKERERERWKVKRWISWKVQNRGMQLIKYFHIQNHHLKMNFSCNLLHPYTTVDKTYLCKNVNLYLHGPQSVPIVVHENVHHSSTKTKTSKLTISTPFYIPNTQLWPVASKNVVTVHLSIDEHWKQDPVTIGIILISKCCMSFVGGAGFVVFVQSCSSTISWIFLIFTDFEAWRMDSYYLQ